MSKIRQELVKATGMENKRGESFADFAIRLVLAVQELDDKEWGKLSEPAQDWFNDAAEAVNLKKVAPDFPDAEPEPETKPSRRGRVQAAAEPEPEPSKDPQVGDTVTVTTKRGKSYTGKVLELDAEVIVLDVDGKDVEITLAGATVEVQADVGDGAADPETPEDPEVGDTVQVTTSRDKVIMGKIVELDDETMVIQDASGDDHELGKARLKSVVVKAKGKAPAPEPAETKRRGRASAEPEATTKATKATKGDNGGVSVGTRIRELCVENMAASEAEIGKMLAKEGLSCKENTLGMAYGDAHRMIKLLADRKLLK